MQQSNQATLGHAEYVPIQEEAVREEEKQEGQGITLFLWEAAGMRGRGG